MVEVLQARRAWIIGMIQLTSAQVWDCVVGIGMTEHVSSDILLEHVHAGSPGLKWTKAQR
jgi:hypothetical protein